MFDNLTQQPAWRCITERKFTTYYYPREKINLNFPPVTRWKGRKIYWKKYWGLGMPRTYCSWARVIKGYWMILELVFVIRARANSTNQITVDPRFLQYKFSRFTYRNQSRRLFPVKAETRYENSSGCLLMTHCSK